MGRRPSPLIVEALDEKRREDEAVDAPSGAEGDPGGAFACQPGEDEGARIGQLVGRGDEAGPGLKQGIKEGIRNRIQAPSTDRSAEILAT